MKAKMHANKASDCMCGKHKDIFKANPAGSANKSAAKSTTKK